MWNLRTAESVQAVFGITLVCALVFLSTANSHLAAQGLGAASFIIYWRDHKTCGRLGPQGSM